MGQENWTKIKKKKKKMFLGGIIGLKDLNNVVIRGRFTRIRGHSKKIMG